MNYVAFPVFCSLSIILITAFVVTKKNLHLFEVMFIWMIAIIIDHNFMTVVSVNLGMYEYADQPSRYWSLALVRIVLIPLLIVWYFDKTSSKTAFKWIFLPIGIALLIGIEYLSEILNVFDHTHWKLWWSIIEWFAVFLIINYCSQWYRNVLRREVQ